MNMLLHVTTPAKERKRRKREEFTVSVRPLKVQYHCGTYSCIQQSKILLQGMWLEAAGFSVGDEINVTVMDKRLVIERV